MGELRKEVLSLAASQRAILKRLTSVEDRIKVVEQENAATDVWMRSALIDCKNNAARLESQMKGNELVISGLLSSSGEDLPSLMSELFTAIDVTIPVSVITNVYRMGTSTSDRPARVLLKLTSKRACDTILATKLKNKPTLLRLI